MKREESARNSFWVYNIEKNRWSCIYKNENTGHQYWTKMQNVEPCPRFAHQLVYDHVNKVLFIWANRSLQTNCWYIAQIIYVSLIASLGSQNGFGLGPFLWPRQINTFIQTDETANNSFIFYLPSLDLTLSVQVRMLRERSVWAHTDLYSSQSECRIALHTD